MTNPYTAHYTALIKLIRKDFGKCLDCNKTLSKKKYKYCKKHANMGDRNPYWAGDKVGYTGVHRWVKKLLPKQKLCEWCKNTNNSTFIELANVTGIYCRELNNWKWLCRSCHSKFDGKRPPSFQGKKHSLVTKLKMSRIAILNGNGKYKRK